MSKAAAIAAPASLAMAYAALMLASALWAGTGIAGRAVYDELSPAALTFWMWAAGSLVAWFIAGREVRDNWPQIIAKWRAMLAISVMSTFGFFWLVFVALQFTSATTHALLNSTVPVWVLLINWVVFQRAPRGLELAGFALSILGVAAIIFRGDPANIIALRFNVADLLILLAMILWAVHLFLLPHRPQLSPLAFVAVTGTIGAAIAAPLYVWDLVRGTAHPVMSTGVFVSIFYVVVLRTLLATIVFNFGVDRVGPLRSALFTHLVPIFGTIGAYFVLGEEIRGYHLVGLMLVLAGIVLANRRLA